MARAPIDEKVVAAFIDVHLTLVHEAFDAAISECADVAGQPFDAWRELFISERKRFDGVRRRIAAEWAEATL